MKAFLCLAMALMAAATAACAGPQPTSTPSPTSTPVPTPAPVMSPVRLAYYIGEENFQFLNLYVAVGAGFFKEEGVDVQLVRPPNPIGSGQFLLQSQADVALLQPPIFLGLIGQAQPILLFANTLENDPIDLVVRKEVVEARKLSPAAPLAERLQGMQGLKIGVAPNPPPRLRALFASVGMDADRDIQMVIVPGADQDAAFAEGRVDALYSHSPHLERAIVEQGGVLLVNQSRGEIPELTGVEIHSLVTTRQFATTNPQAILAITRAIYRAQQLLHSDQKAAVDALFRVGLTGLDRKRVETIVAIYAPAIPKTPDVSIKGIEKANTLYPVIGGSRPDFTKINLADYIAPQFARQAVTGSQ